MERQALASQQHLVVFRAAGAEVDEEWPSLEVARGRLDEVLEAEPRLAGLDPRKRELFELMGVGRG